MNSKETAATIDSYRKKGLGGRIGFGDRPAVVVVDFICGFTNMDCPLAAPLDKEIVATIRLLRVARSHAIPIVFSTVRYDNPERDAGLFLKKISSLKYLQTDSPWVELDPRLDRQPDELVLTKKFASCFFGTAFASYLNKLGVDTLVVAGCTTSGCVRATVVDALQHGFRPVVPKECVGDRAPGPHAANLLDMDSKYADVVSLSLVIAYFRNVSRT